MTLSIGMRDLRVIVALCSTLLLVACLQPYRMEIQQGNLFDQSTLDQVKVGMTKKQVRFLLGTPLVNDPFHVNRWDYFYSLYSHDKEISERYQISVIFSEKGVSEIIRGQLPSNPTAAPEAKLDKPGLLGRLLKTVNPFD